jgi:hypothetical protein
MTGDVSRIQQAVAGIPQQRRPGLVFLESDAAIGPWTRRLEQAATEFVRQRRNRKQNHNRMKGL